jgi:phospholipid transport system substrate-binding protein
MRLKPVIMAVLAGLLIGAICPPGVIAASPTETVKAPIDQVVEILNDPAYRGPDKRALQRDKIWELVKPLFDFEEISRRTVGPDWERFTDPEKQRFTEVFSQFLGNTYIDKMQSEYQNEKIRFDGEVVREAQAMVRTQLIRQGAVTIPIDYRMKQDGGSWRVYDILVENGVSLIKNYRVQFQSSLQKETPAQLIERLQKKLAESGNALRTAK